MRLESRLAVTVKNLLAGAACAVWAMGAATAVSGDDGGAMAIAEARSRPDGSTVTVEGFVTVAPGTYASATLEQGFAIESGDAGIYVSITTPVELALDDRVRVTGALGQMNKMTVLTTDAMAIEKLEGRRIVAPQTVATGSVGEAFEGRLIKVSGRVTKEVADDSPYGFKVFVDDGSGEIQLFIHINSSRPLVKLGEISKGDRVEAVGLGFQYEDTYEVNPRRDADFTEVNQ